MTKRIILLIISTFVLSISYAIGQTHNETTSEDTIKSFLTKMYNDELYEEMVYSALAQELISSSKAAQMLNTSIMEIEAKSQAL